MIRLVRLLAMTVALAIVFAAGSANATVIINVTDMGGNVVFTTTGSLDLTGASGSGNYASYGQGFIPGGDNWYVAPGPGGATNAYALTSFAGPFGTSLNFFTPPSSTSGDDFFIWGDAGVTAQVGLPVGYVSGGSIDSGMVFNGATIAGFTMTPGTYDYALPNDTIILNVGNVNPTVPEPTSFLLLGTGVLGIGLAAWRRKKA